ncbi:ParB/RepB/Spo0J family partition protein [Aliarcobacter butzleri]|uniref:ParB/RepB/Spo0J family partition protein n=1 Tax=Aliarcobacter butzleri TaxID=28197 RepID=UPI0024DEF54B|nr:ParB/RepB/Spo0J family partition protein [Aliarcobacter butzleri]MDK2050549.1 ParB/RepB/Spo0J family partition protein [Aliarcobacter butzleri]
MKPNLAEITKATAGKTKTSGISPFSELEISKVYPNPDQPRKAFEDIEELATTIQEHGLLQPITVVKKDDGYMIVSGERRYKAHLFNEAKTIKAYILDATDEEVQELTLIENIQRNDLTDFEIANHIVGLWKTGRYEKKSDLAKKVGKSESYVSKAFSSLNLDDEILEDIAVNKKDISISVMDEISRVKDKKVQKEVYQKYNAGEITRDDIKDFKEPKSESEACNENFPTGNLEATFKVGDLVQDKAEILEARIKELEKEIEELNNKEVYIVSYRQKKGTEAGGGFRCRALHQGEAIEIAKQSKYKDLANDKNIIWETRTLKSSCNEANLDDYIGYGFGTVNDMGTYIAVIDGDFEATITFKKNGEFVKDTNNREYQVIIKEISHEIIEKPKETKQPKKTTKLEDKKEIALLELFSEAVTINYTNYDIDMGIDYKEAKKIIDKSKQESIPFNVGKGTDERAYRLINTDVRTIKDDCIIFIGKDKLKQK